MSMSKIIVRGFVALALAGAPLASIAPGSSDIAFAKGGNGGNGGKGGGNGNGGGHGSGGSQGKSGSHGKARSSEGKSGHARTSSPNFLDGVFDRGKKPERASGKAVKAKTKVVGVPTPKPQSAHLKTAKLSSLGRSYRAYMNSNDPRMAAISAYAMAYAAFEAEYGPDAIPTDPALSEEALRDAIASFTNGGEVTDETLAGVQETLGVGPAFGKIDQIREHLLRTTPEEDIGSEY